MSFAAPLVLAESHSTHGAFPTAEIILTKLSRNPMLISTGNLRQVEKAVEYFMGEELDISLALGFRHNK